MYKKIIFLAVIMLSAVITFAQPSQYTPMTAQGYQFKRILTDSTLHLPSFCGVPTLRNSTAKNGALAMDTCNNKLYQWTNQAGWTDITTGGIDTTSLSNRINLKVNISDTASMLSKYLRKIDTTAMLLPYLRKVDTTSMLSKYLRKVDTTAMLQPYLQKIDTTAMLQPYLRKIDTTAMLSKYLRKVDTTAMLSKYLRKIDTTAMLQPYLRKIDTTIMLQPYLRKIDTSSMLLPYLRKIDTTSMLSKYLRKVDTTNKWVTNIISVNDTTFRFFKGTTSTDITIHAGGGSGSTPDLQAVTTVGATTTNPITIDGSGGTLIDFKPINIDNFAGDYAYGFETAIGADYYAYPVFCSDAYSDSFYIQTYNAGSDQTQRVVGLNNGSGSRFELSTGQSTGASLSLRSTAAVGSHVMLESGSAVATDEIIHLPIMDGNTDTLATLADVRNGGGGGGIDTTSLSNRIDQKLNITDTTNKWVSAVTQLNDSTIRVVKDGTTNDYIIRTSVAGSATRLVTTVYNNSGSTITKGSVVYINGRHSSNLPTIALAQADTEANSYSTFALVENNIANNNSGIVIQAGNITNLNLPTSSFTDGQVVYLSPTVAGGITTTKPLAPDHIVKIGTITRAHPTFGTIELKIENGWQMDELSDVQIPAVPADSTLLQYSRVDSLWHAVSPANAIGLKNGGTKTYSSTITWTGTAPTGTTNHTYSWTQIGKMVTLSVRLVYGTAGATNTGVQMAIPADCPTPSSLAGLGSAQDFLYPGTAYLHTATTTPTAFCRGGIRNNPANNGLEMYAIIAASTSVRTVWLTVTYWTN
jgi:hypothetical protein